MPTEPRTHRARRENSVRIASRLVRALVNLALVVTVLAAAAWVLPAAFGYQRYVITGGSMSGTFEKGAVVFATEVPVSDLAVGDVITYQPPASSGVSNLVTHRVHTIRTNRDGALILRTQGDANPESDPWTFTLDTDTQPVVAFSVPLVGHLLIALGDRDTRMLAIGVPAALIALGALVQLLGAIGNGIREGRVTSQAAARAKVTKAA